MGPECGSEHGDKNGNRSKRDDATKVLIFMAIHGNILTHVYESACEILFCLFFRPFLKEENMAEESHFFVIHRSFINFQGGHTVFCLHKVTYLTLCQCINGRYFWGCMGRRVVGVAMNVA